MIPDETSIVRAIVSMGRSLKLKVIAEGVETIQELEFLQALGCDEAQGYFFSRPVPAGEFEALLFRQGNPEMLWPGATFPFVRECAANPGDNDTTEQIVNLMRHVEIANGRAGETAPLRYE
jgi:hypothetical protein